MLICSVGCGGLLTWGVGGGEGKKCKRYIESPGFRSPEVGISFICAIL